MHVVEGVKTPTNEGTSSVKVQKEDPYKEYRELEDTISYYFTFVMDKMDLQGNIPSLYIKLLIN